jgi:sugar (pentulose or hexulose) kinase
MRDQLLAIDNGTQSVRALIFNLRGDLLAKSQVYIEPYFARQPGWAEQNPEYYWSTLCQACQGLWTKPGVRKEAIAGVALTTQRATVVNVDKQGKPLRPAIVWLDQRRTPGLPPLSGLWGLAFKLARMSETIAYIQAEAEANWIRTHEPDIWAETYKYLYLSGYLTYKLTGRFADSVGCQVGFMPFDYKRLRWAAKWDWKWRAVSMDPSLLAELVPPAGEIGAISEPGGRRDWHSAGAAADRGGRGQSVRGDRRRRAEAAHWLSQLRHYRHNHYDADALYRADPADSALPGRDSPRLQPGGANLSRLLDGELVQDRVRPA